MLAVPFRPHRVLLLSHPLCFLFLILVYSSNITALSREPIHLDRIALTQFSSFVQHLTDTSSQAQFPLNPL